MKRTNGKGDVRTSASRPAATTVSPPGNRGHEHRVTNLEEGTPQENRIRGCTALSYLLLREDGWLRITPSRDGKTVYFKWKFSHGKWTNHYVMTVFETWAWDLGLAELEEKCRQVDMGARTPTLDTWFNQHPDGVPVVP